MITFSMILDPMFTEGELNLLVASSLSDLANLIMFNLIERV